MRAICFIVVWLLALGARADETRARELFGAGVDAMLTRNWPEAARLFEESLQHTDKPACRFNLVIANRELGRPLEVARHALVFLRSTEARAHVEESTEVQSYLSKALRELGTLELDSLPPGAQAMIDHAAPRVVEGARIYELPGLHRLELWLDGRQLESIELELAPGTIQAWPRVRALREMAAADPLMHEAAANPSAVPSPQPAGEARPSLVPAKNDRFSATSRRRKLAWTLGVAGAATGLAALGSYAFAVSRIDDLRHRDPAANGYIPAARRYEQARDSVMPLALTGGVLMAAGAALVGRKPRAAMGVSIATLVVGVAATSLGAALMARTPKTLVEGTQVVRPTLEAGSLCIGVALPLLTYGGRLQWELWRGARAEGR